MTTKASEKYVEQFEVGVHTGNILHYTAHHYAEPPAVIRECVQNAIDKRASHILVVIDALRRTIKVFDDGLGASLEEIKEKFGTIAKSLKVDPSDIGEKGIGNLAGLAIAEKYHLITKPRDSQEPMRRYSLERSKLLGQEKVHMDVEIWPGKKVTDSVGFSVSTLVQLVEVNEQALRRLNNVQVLERVILESFARKIRENKIHVGVSYTASSGKGWDKTVEPGKYRGTKLPVETYQTDFGPVAIEMYYSQKPLENPNLVIEYKDKYSISLGNLAHSMVGQLSDTAWAIFKKGYFEGTIQVGFGTLAAHRGYFEWDDELMALNGVIEEFANHVLRPHIERIEDETREEKYRKVLDDVLKKVNSFYQDHPDLRPDILHDAEPVNQDEGQPLTPPEPKPKIPIKDILHHEREKRERERREPPAEREAKQKDKMPRKINRRPGNLFEIVCVNPEEEYGINWHSRRDNSVIEINAQNSDFSFAERLGMSKLRDYFFLLVQKELTCASLEPSSARLFNDRFEDTFMALYRAGIGQ